MELKCLKWLDDVRQATELISQVTYGLTESDDLANRFLRCGVERSFEIIGEALARITMLRRPKTEDRRHWNFGLPNSNNVSAILAKRS